MRILAFDTAGRGCSVTIWNDGTVEASLQKPMAHGQAERLVPLIGTACEQGGVTWDDIDRLAVTIGPGSFTGLRVGLATAHGLSLASARPVVGISSLEVFATQALMQPPRPVAANTLIVSIVDARRDDLYVQPFHTTARNTLEPLEDPQACPVEDLPAAVVEWQTHCDATQSPILVGDAVEMMPATDQPILRISSPMVDGAVLAELASTRDPASAPPRPLYIRAPDAALPRNGGQLRPAAAPPPPGATQ